MDFVYESSDSSRGRGKTIHPLNIASFCLDRSEMLCVFRSFIYVSCVRRGTRSRRVVVGFMFMRERLLQIKLILSALFVYFQ